MHKASPNLCDLVNVKMQIFILVHSSTTSKFLYMGVHPRNKAASLIAPLNRRAIIINNNSENEQVGWFCLPCKITEKGLNFLLGP